MFVRVAAVAAAVGTLLLPLGVRAADSTTAATAPPVLTAQEQARIFKDVPSNSFAYRAVRQLEEDHLIEGYPDGTFKGNRPLTRYEAAVITERVVQLLADRMRQPGAGVSAADLAAVRTLLDEFKGDINALNARVAQIDDRLKTVERRQGTDEAAAQRDEASVKSVQTAQQAIQAKQATANVHVLYFIRPGTFQDGVSAYAGGGAALAPGTTLTTNDGLGSGINTGRNTLFSGLQSRGVGYQVLRLFVDGALDSRVSYNLRLENRYYFDNATNNGSSNGTAGTASTAPQLCSNAGGAAFGAAGATCGNDYPTNSTMRLNYANMVYKDPSGFSVTAGRYFQQNDSLGLAYADYFNGVQVAYGPGRLKLQAGYSFNFPSLSNGSSAGTSGQTIFGQASYNFAKQLTGQVSFVTDINPQLTLWNPSALASAGTYALYPGQTRYAGAYAAANVPISVGSAFVQYSPNDQLTFAVEGLHRFGTDPFTKATWSQPNAIWAQAQFGATHPAPFKAYVEGGFIGAGFNSVGGHTNIIGTTNYEQFYLANPNGYEIAYGGIHYWLSKAARVGLVYVHYNLIPGTDIPAGVQPTATSSGCPGCYVGGDAANGLFLQGLVSF